VWSRDELFAKIERIVWRRLTLSVLIILTWFVAAGLYNELSTAHIALGVVLIVLVFPMCLYLGLMQTRGMRWSDASIATAAGLSAMAFASFATSSQANLESVVLCEAVFLTLAVIFRYWAKRRWAEIDWLLCKPTAVA
jgi:uncharacterized membrane protein (DUF441 family)